jgi:hypothetical protein
MALYLDWMRNGTYIGKMQDLVHLQDSSQSRTQASLVHLSMLVVDMNTQNSLSLSMSFPVILRHKTNQMEGISWTLSINQGYLYSIFPPENKSS